LVEELISRKRSALTSILDDFMHFENIGAGKYLRGRPVSVRFLELSAVGPSLERWFVLPMSQDDIVVALHRPWDLQADESRHVLNQPRSSLEAFLELFLPTLRDLKSIRNNDHVSAPLLLKSSNAKFRGK
jgi:hypothetical protein